MNDTARLAALEARVVTLEQKVSDHGKQIERLRLALALLGHIADKAKA